MTSREVMLLQKRLERAEAAIRRITQVESKPRLVVNPGGTGGGGFVEEVRWADPVLEYRIGSTWFTIDTAENCNTVSPFISGLGI